MPGKSSWQITTSANKNRLKTKRVCHKHASKSKPVIQISKKILKLSKRERRPEIISSDSEGDLQIILDDGPVRQPSVEPIIVREAATKRSIISKCGIIEITEDSNSAKSEKQSKKDISVSVASKREPDHFEEPFFENQPSLVECLGLQIGRKRKLIKLNQIEKNNPTPGVTAQHSRNTETVVEPNNDDETILLAKARAEIIELRQQLAEKSRRLSGLGFMSASPYDEATCAGNSPEMVPLLNMRDKINHTLVKDYFGNVMEEVSNQGSDLQSRSNKELVEFRDKLLARSREGEQSRLNWITDGSQYREIDLKLLKSADGIIEGYVKKTEDVLYNRDISVPQKQAQPRPKTDAQEVRRGKRDVITPMENFLVQENLYQKRRRKMSKDPPNDVVDASSEDIAASDQSSEDSCSLSLSLISSESLKWDQTPYSPSDSMVFVGDGNENVTNVQTSLDPSANDNPIFFNQTPTANNVTTTTSLGQPYSDSMNFQSINPPIMSTGVYNNWRGDNNYISQPYSAISSIIPIQALNSFQSYEPYGYLNFIQNQSFQIDYYGRQYYY